jgi:hypothetical protein
VPSRNSHYQVLREIEDHAFTLAGIQKRLEPVETWLGQNLLINGADQQLINLLDAARLLQAARQRLLDELAQERKNAPGR